MKFSEYIKLLKNDVLIFEKEYKQKNNEFPEQYPLDMLHGDWEDQFNLWISDECSNFKEPI